jgi:methylated-DNA-[protein]-cysteine S-methyltransferase
MKHFHSEIQSHLGRLTLIADETHLLAVLWENDRLDRVRLERGEPALRHPVLMQAERELTEYFDGGRQAFNVPLRWAGTPFQSSVWNALRDIPYGKTWSYSELALAVNSPRACRAVGAANGRNPLSIIVPCHRVIGKSGALTGFAGGSEAKAYLLRLEASSARTL